MAGGKVREPKEATTLPEKDYQDLRSTIQYLAGIHGVETMWGLFGWLATELDWNSLTRWEVGETILTGLKLANGSKVDDYVASYEHYLECDNVSSALGFNRVSFYAISEGWTSGEENKKDHSLYIIVKNGVLEAAENAGAPMKPLPLQAFPLHHMVLLEIPFAGTTSPPNAFAGHTSPLAPKMLHLGPG